MPFRRIAAAAATLLYPPTCVLCGAAGAYGLDLCVGCRSDLPRITPCCPRCAQPLPEPRLCGACLRRPPPFTVCRSPFRYEDPLPALVGGAKFRGRFNLIRLLGTLLAEALAACDDPRPDAIVPVPLHPRRLRERGYNQSLELARVIARRLDIGVDAGCCERVRATPPQMALTEKERMRNVRGAFAAQAQAAGRHVAILDDVVTTGGTVGELSRALKAAGCSRVDVWAVARTP